MEEDELCLCDYHIEQGVSSDGKVTYSTQVRNDESYMQYYDDPVGAFKNWFVNLFKGKD